jgi:methanogenic corrinoid protein MtbC1
VVHGLKWFAVGRVLAEVKKDRSIVVLGSSLMTRTIDAFLETADRLLQEGLKPKLPKI